MERKEPWASATLMTIKPSNNKSKEEKGKQKKMTKKKNQIKVINWLMFPNKMADDGGGGRSQIVRDCSCVHDRKTKEQRRL